MLYAGGDSLTEPNIRLWALKLDAEKRFKAEYDAHLAQWRTQRKYESLSEFHGREHKLKDVKKYIINNYVLK